MTQAISSESAKQPEASGLTRSPEKLSKDAFKLVYGLAMAQPWLKDESHALGELIDECANLDQQDLICRLLHRFLMLDHDAFGKAIQAIADHVQDDLGLVPSETYLVSLDDGKYADSAEFVLYALKNAAWKDSGWGMLNFVKPRSTVLELPVRKHIVLVDEFVGTGRTVMKSVKKLRAQLAEKELEYQIHFAAIAGMDAGRNCVSGVVADPFFAHVLQKGISDHASEGDVEKAIGEMKVMESRLAPQSPRGTLATHHLGYGKSEALYSRLGGNTPNNVFPVFWWREYADGSRRKAILKCT